VGYTVTTRKGLLSWPIGPGRRFVAASAGTPLGHRYAALCTACSIAERVRDDGGHALVVLDDISCMVRR
jgi:F0F1-type ATP synthase alpha subunit